MEIRLEQRETTPKQNDKNRNGDLEIKNIEQLSGTNENVIIGMMIFDIYSTTKKRNWNHCGDRDRDRDLDRSLESELTEDRR